MQDPLISICISAKRPDFLNVSIRSALGQSYGNVETIVSDQSTTDDIAKICQQYPEVQYHRLPQTKTDSSLEQRNIAHAIERSSGSFINLLNDSQVLHPFALERLLEPHIEDARVGVSFGGSRQIDAFNQMGEIHQVLRSDSPVSLPGDRVVRQIARGSQDLMSESSVIFIRRSIVSIKSGEIDFFGKRLCFDAHLALCILGAVYGNIFYTPQVMSYVRFREELTEESKLHKWRQSLDGIFRSEAMNRQEQHQAVKRYLKKCSTSTVSVEDIEWGQRMLQYLSSST